MKTTFHNYALTLVALGNKIVIASGEGEQGSYTEYKGKSTERALKAHLTNQKCNGDRWARAYVLADGKTYINMETGQQEYINI